MDQSKFSHNQIKMFALISIFLPKNVSLGTGSAKKGLEILLAERP